MGKIELIRLALVVTSGLTAVPALAQEAAEQQTSNPADIIVTARRTEERLQDVPISITVFSQQDLAKRNISNIGDLGTYTPSLSTNSRFGAEKSSFAIRGFTQEAKTSPSVGVYFADVVGLRANSGTAAGNGAGVGDLFDLQNVQVLKGPQGTLFGRNTTGGAVLLVPHKPVDDFEGYVEGSLGNYDMRRLQGVLNVPVAETFFVRAGVDWQKRDGYLKNKSGIGPDRLANVDYISARVSVLGELTPNLENNLIVSFTDSHTDGSVNKLQVCNRDLAKTPAGFLAALGCAQVDRQNARGDGFYDVENSLPNPRIDTRQWRVINTTTWTASDSLTIKNIVSYGEFREKNAYSVFGDNYALAPGVALPLLTIGPGVSGVTADQSTFTEELQFQGSVGDGRFKWVAGGYMEISRPLSFASQYVQQLLNCSDVKGLKCTDLLGFGFGNMTLQQIKDSFDDYGLYAQGTYQLTDSFSLTGGIRYTYDKIRSESDTLVIRFPTPGNPVYSCQNILRFDSNPDPKVFAPVVVSDPAQCDVKYKTTSHRPTWLISAEEKPSDALLLYAKWARGYRAGGINPLILGLDTWGPEKVDTYEVGAKNSFRGALAGYLNVAAFYNDFVNQQLSANLVPAVSGLNAQQSIVNAGKSRIWGVEVDASISPLAGLRFDLGYAYLNTKLKKIDIASSSPLYAQILPNAQTGGSLSLSPRNRVTLSANYTLPLDSSIGDISFGATYVHTDAQNSVSQQSSPLFRLPKSDLLNLNAGWSSIMGSPIDASFFMTNVTGEKFPIFAAGGYPFFGADGVVTNQPRMFGGRLRYHFGT